MPRSICEAELPDRAAGWRWWRWRLSMSVAVGLSRFVFRAFFRCGLLSNLSLSLQRSCQSAGIFFFVLVLAVRVCEDSSSPRTAKEKGGEGGEGR